MRRGVIQRITSRLLGFTVFSLAVPLVFSVADGESIWWAYAIPLCVAMLGMFGLARLPNARSAPSDSLRRREGFVAVVLGWMILVFFTAMAFHLTGAFEGFAESFFESMSGYTTTGATVARDVEILPRSVLFQRCFAHWIGGMGIVVLSIAILPELAVGGMQLFAAESSGVDSDKLAPRIAATARRLWGFYVLLTGALTALLMVGGMGIFDAVLHAMSTTGTGGFSTRNASIAAYDSVFIEIVIMAFMFVAGINFTLQYRALARLQIGVVVRSPEVRLYTLITVAAIFLVTINTYVSGPFDSILTAFRYSAFQVVSIVTTTGFGTYDFDLWPDFSRWLIVILMIIGGCAGSTSGGSKVIRLYVVIKHATSQLRLLVRPRLVEPLHIGDRAVPRETVESILGFYLLYIGATLVIGLSMTLMGLDLVSGGTAAVSAMNSIGPGLGSVGAAEPFADVPAMGLYILSFGMLLGRLEIYTVLVLFIPHFWRRG